ncbi:TetR/AcrR family transcriptional regulator [Bacillus norwichensis]|uniref:TetR/AcrR family transcriptional regulator n=1 Tax=Bacillus norwichensis TaxID=2762217 RepID=A0ABR8VKU3_9BACI|nr:TetR/AcrR family transcriptional regulator [Bacillus norwichensis]MBD8005384.1 TetR/AcrR family transcriptional regulator [Bacillus norwichensis]
MSQTVNKIKKTALFYISKYGYEGTTLKDIAQKVGIKTPSIYSHFNSKEQLFLSIIKDLKLKERESLMKLVLELRKKPIDEVIRAFFYFYTDSNNIASWQIILKQILMHPPASLLQILRKDFEELEKEISIQLSEFFQIGREEGWIKNEDTEQLISLFFTLIDGLLVEQNLYDSEKYEQRREEVWNLYRDFISQ